MARASRQNPAIREFILRNVENNPSSITTATVKEFGLSRTAINRYMKRLIDEGIIEASGKTNARHYKLKKIVDLKFEITEITKFSSEDAVWRFRVLPYIKGIPQNAINICQYGFTEIFNNLIDHSLSDIALVSYEQTYTHVAMMIVDEGVGIFQKIQNDFGLPDARTALLELSKGKLTSDKEHHAGQGIFFTSRMFNDFFIRSGNLLYVKQRKDDNEAMIEVSDLQDAQEGTLVQMKIATNANWTTREIFDQHQGADFSFQKTLVPIKLANYPGEQLVSRSQAKRVFARFDEFTEIILDFEGVDDIGQPFADEMFRVFPLSHPEIKISPRRTNENIDSMIKYVLGSSENN